MLLLLLLLVDSRPGARLVLAKDRVLEESYMKDRFRVSRASLAAIFIILSVFCLLGRNVEAQVRVWKDKLVLPTHEEGLPDINPPFDIFQRRVFSTYPYTTRENLTHRRSDRIWRTLNLENEYLKVVVLPDLGGRLYSCIDKSTGAELFYANSSIKFAQVAYRGAWVALGIEFNFPVSHNWMTVSPVDFGTVRNVDGSASIWVGNIDRSYGMMWRVALTLRPGSSLLEQTVTLYNHDLVRHRYYWWNTCSVESWDDSRIIYPMKYTASHGFTNVDTWPVNSAGFDLSYPKNHTQGFVSRFSHGSREPFMGVYHPRTEAGMVHFAFPDEVPGKKIWSWGWDARGHQWREALSDDKTSYLEVQAGLFRNQETYNFLEPQQFLRFKEYYMPVRKLGGFSRAGLAGALHTSRDPATLALRVGVNVNEELADGMLLILLDDERIHEERLSLQPSGFFDQVFHHLNSTTKYTVKLTNRDGRTLLAHTEDTYDFAPESEIEVGKQESFKFPPSSLRSEADFVEMGKREELNGRLLEAFELYREGIGRFPNSFQLNKAGGRLAVQLKRYREAIDMLSVARWRIDNDQELLYYLGTAWMHLGEAGRARAAWEGATIVPGFRVPAQLQLGRLWSQSGKWNKALEIVRRLLAEAPQTLRAGYLEVALLRRMGQVTKANQRLDYWQEIDPPNSFFRNEGILQGAQDEALWHHLAGDPERILGLAVEYMAMGFYDDAIQLLTRVYPSSPVLSEPGTPLPKDYPLISYYRGYCREKLGLAGGPDFETASGQPTLYVFPNRPETIWVLQSALKHDPDDATAHLLLGSLHLSGGKVEKAMQEWRTARRLNPHLPTLHRNLGYTQLIAASDPKTALSTFSEGLKMDPENVDNYLGSDQCMSLLDVPPQERIKIFKNYPDLDSMPPVLLLSLALALTEAGLFDEADALFPGREFIREEFGTSVHEVYMELQLQKALAYVRADKPGAARTVIQGLGKLVPGLSFTAEGGERFLSNKRVQYYLGEIQQACGSTETAKAHWEAAATAERYGDLYFGYLAAGRLGRDVTNSEWKEQLETALEAAKSYSGFNQGRAAYSQGSLLLALDRRKEAFKTLRTVFLLPDKGRSHYLSRELLRSEQKRREF